MAYFKYCADMDKADGTEIWVKELTADKTKSLKSFAVVYFNRNDKSVDMSEKIGILLNNATLRYDAYDLLRGNSHFGTFGPHQKVELPVPPMGVRMFKLISLM